MFSKIHNGIKTYLHDLHLLTPNARNYLLGSFFIGITFAAFLLLLNLYLREKGLSESAIGRVQSAGALGMTLVSIPGAILMSRIRLKPVLFASTILFVIFGLVTVSADAEPVIWISYFFAWAAMTFYRIASAPFFMRNSTETERPYLFSLSFGLGVAAGVLGSFIFGKLVVFFGSQFDIDSVTAHRLSLACGVFVSLAALIPFGLLKMPANVPADDRLKIDLKILAPLKGLIFKLTFPYFVVGTGAGIIIPFLNLYFRDRFGCTSDEIGLYFGLVSLTTFIGVMSGPVLVRKIGMVRSIVNTQMASIPFMLVLAFSFNFPLVIFAFLARGALMNMGQPIGNNFAMEMVPRSLHGLVNAFLMFAWTSSWMISTQIGGLIIEKHGYTPSLIIAVILYVISSLLYYFWFRSSEKKTGDGFEIRAPFKLPA